jgi:hypothetical protein
MLFVTLPLVLNLPVREKRFRAATFSVPFDDRLTNGPFCGYALARDDSAERVLLRGGFTISAVVLRGVVSLPERANRLRLDLPVSVFVELLLTNGPRCGYTLFRAD